MKMSNPPLGIVPPLEYLLNDAPGSPMSSPRGPIGGGAFIVARRGTVYVTPKSYVDHVDVMQATAFRVVYVRVFQSRMVIAAISQPCMAISAISQPRTVNARIIQSLMVIAAISQRRMGNVRIFQPCMVIAAVSHRPSSRCLWWGQCDCSHHLKSRNPIASDARNGRKLCIGTNTGIHFSFSFS